MIRIGLSDCDEARELRTAFAKSLSAELKVDRFPFEEAIDLFLEALSNYQNGAYLGTALLCRASMETAIYFAVSRSPMKYDEDTGKAVSVKMTIDHIREQWPKLLERAGRYHFIGDDVTKSIESIRQKGNFVAHMGQKIDKEIGGNDAKLEAKGFIRGISSINRSQWESADSMSPESWIDVAGAQTAIRETVRVLNSVYKKWQQMGGDEFTYPPRN